MTRLVLKSWVLLLYFEVLMLTRNFNALYTRVSKEPLRAQERKEVPPSEILSRAMDYACVFYFKQVLCLQRSAATTLLFRRYGLAAEMVIGIQLMPFKSHAWVEVAHVVVNDKPYMRAMYQVLDHC